MATKITGGRGRKGGSVTQLPGTQRQSGTGGDGRPLTSVDNLSPEERAAAAEKQRKEREGAEAIQLLSIVSRAKKQLLKVEVKRAELKVEQDAFSDIARAGKTAIKITRAQLMEMIEDSNPEGRRNVTEEEQKRARWRKAMGLPVGMSDEQMELDARLPEVERGGLYYQGLGYTDGVTGAPHNVPDGCAAAGHGNRYDAGYKDGQKALNDALQAAKGRPAPAPKPKPDPNEDLSDPHSPASLRAAAQSQKRAQDSLEAMGKKVGDEIVDGDPLGVEAATNYEPGGPDDPHFHYGSEDCASCGASPGFTHGDDCPVLVARGIKPKSGEAEPEAVG